jgi:hypothetical protein
VGRGFPDIEPRYSLENHAAFRRKSLVRHRVASTREKASDRTVLCSGTIQPQSSRNADKVKNNPAAHSLRDMDHKGLDEGADRESMDTTIRMTPDCNRTLLNYYNPRQGGLANSRSRTTSFVVLLKEQQNKQVRSFVANQQINLPREAILDTVIPSVRIVASGKDFPVG